jgi:LysR family glycine cleavage system transcriptional activator
MGISPFRNEKISTMKHVNLAHVSLSSLRAFEAVSRLGSVADAADELNVSVSAVSHQLRELQQVLGVELTKRDGRNIGLTQLGMAFASDLTLGFEHLNRGLRRVLARSDREVLTMTVLPWFASRWLIPRLAGFQQQHPLHVTCIT